MKTPCHIALIFSLLLLACEPTMDLPMERYTIEKGKHYATYRVEMLQSDLLQFQAMFDESAAYTAQTEENQWDTNKLFGFADCNSHHHENSARFGWRWIDDQIDILAYCYVGGERTIELVGRTKPGKINTYEILLTEDQYIFKMDDQSVMIERKKPCDAGVYYLLFPYFGGNETAPHDINIFIRRLY